jgi:hypothetical protein
MSRLQKLPFDPQIRAPARPFRRSARVLPRASIANLHENVWRRLVIGAVRVLRGNRDILRAVTSPTQLDGLLRRRRINLHRPIRPIPTMGIAYRSTRRTELNSHIFGAKSSKNKHGEIAAGIGEGARVNSPQREICRRDTKRAHRIPLRCPHDCGSACTCELRGFSRECRRSQTAWRTTESAANSSPQPIP